MKKTKIITITLLACAYFSQAQDPLKSTDTIPRMLPANPLTMSLDVDGKLDEGQWQTIEASSRFKQKWPVDTAYALNQCEVKILYDKKFLYFGITCHDPSPQVLQTLKRDKGFWSSDAFGILLDPQNEHNNGYLFGITSFGNQTDAYVHPNGQDYSWDCKWYSETSRTNDRWTAEIAIPFSVLKYPTSGDWGINFIHCDMRRNMYSVWEPVPRTLSIEDLGYLGTLKWPTPLGKSHKLISVNPYIKGQHIQEKLDDDQNKTEETTASFGLDLRMAVTSATNLDVTFNPDFSQVDVDEQQINLTQFQLLFPEKRNFFLENSDIFSQFGSWNVRPFFSRSIGLQNGRASPIKYGVRYTGNLTSKLRFGVLNIQEGGLNGDPGKNYSMLAMQQRFWKRSSAAFMATNVQETNKNGLVPESFSRNVGFETNINSGDNKWRSNAHIHYSYGSDKKDPNHFYSLLLEHYGANFGGLLELNSLETDFTTEMGISLRQWHYDSENDQWHRQGYKKVWSKFFYHLFGKEGSKITVNYPVLENEIVYYNQDIGYRNNCFKWGFEFVNRGYFESGIRSEYNRLLYPLNFTEGENLPAAGYTNNSFFALYHSDDRKRVKNYMKIEGGSFYTGNKLTISEDVRIRFQPYINLVFGVTYNNIKLPDPYNSAKIFLATVSTELSVNKNLFWTNYLQYNTQLENFNINSRFRWRFSPMSDFFVILSNNYSDQRLVPLNSSLVTRVNYWLTF